MNFDATGLELAFIRLQKSAEKKGRDFAQDQGTFFLRLTRKLGWALTPTKDTLNALLLTYGGRLKRKAGVTPAKEIARRKRARGTFGRRWYIKSVETNKLRIRITIANTVSYADIQKLSVVAVKAAEVVGGRFQNRLKGLAAKIMGDFKR